MLFARPHPRTQRMRGLRRHLGLVFGILLLACSLFSLPLHAQRHESALSEGEIEKIREAAYVPTDRVLLFITFLDLRSKEIEDLFAHPRRPGREQDTHDLIEQFTSIADELSDNLDDYGPRHSDVRKALPKLLLATERWSSAIKSAPENEAYNVSRKIALESIRDLRESATQLTDEQAAWFKAHPPVKEPQNQPSESRR